MGFSASTSIFYGVVIDTESYDLDPSDEELEEVGEDWGSILNYRNGGKDEGEHVGIDWTGSLASGCADLVLHIKVFETIQASDYGWEEFDPKTMVEQPEWAGQIRKFAEELGLKDILEEVLETQNIGFKVAASFG